MKRQETKTLRIGTALLAFALGACAVKIRNPGSQSNSNFAIFGQLNQTSNGCFGASLTGSTYCAPTDVKLIAGKWVVSDFDNQRILIYAGALGASTYVQIGGVFSPGAAISSTTATRIQSLASNGTDLIAIESDLNRVLIWNQLPTQDQQPADAVIGQPDFSSVYANQGSATPSANTLKVPVSATVTNGKLFIADSGNYRVLGFNQIPTQNNASADFALGQNSMNTGTAQTLSASSMQPFGLSSDSSNLVVTDGEIYPGRVLIYHSIPHSMNVPANVALGVTSLTANTYPASAAASFGAVTGILVAGGKVFVGDWSGSRVLFWNSLSTATTGQSADGVLGQPDLTTINAVAPPYTASELLWPFGMVYDSDSDNLMVVDRTGNRITAFNQITTQNGSSAIANVVAGQPDGSTINWNQVSLYNVGYYPEQASSIAFTSKSLLVGNSSHVLVYDKNSPGSAAVNVIGAPDFSTFCVTSCPTSATQVQNVTGLAVDSKGVLYISDSTNNRVLVYNEVPTLPGAAADFVLGQPSMNVGTANNTGSGAQALSNPTSLAVVGTELFVSDTGNNRVLGFSLPITGNQPAAIVVVGQPDFNTATSGLAAAKMNQPNGVASDGAHLFVTDSSNNRVLVYEPIPIGEGAPATAVLGQNNFNTSSLGFSSNQWIGQPSQPAVVDGTLVVSDDGGWRTFGFSINELATGMNPTWIIDQGRLSGVGLTTDPWTGWLWLAGTTPGANNVMGPSNVMGVNPAVLSDYTE